MKSSSSSFLILIKNIFKYVIIFDAGSSGTRTHVYEWNADYNSNSNNQLIIKEVLYCVNDGTYLAIDKPILQINLSFFSLKIME